jgi:hypothetical protein
VQGHEYVFDDEEKQRTFGEHLVFYTGAAYMSGIAVGVSMGMLGTPRAPRHPVLVRRAQTGP